MAPTITLDEGIIHLQSRYIIPQDAPVCFGGRCDRGSRWQLSCREEDANPIRLSETEQLVHTYLHEQQTAYQFHPGLGIFYALLTAADERHLRQAPFGCDVWDTLPLTIADILAGAKK